LICGLITDATDERFTRPTDVDHAAHAEGDNPPQAETNHGRARECHKIAGFITGFIAGFIT
jgi:hypothetical protein